MSLQVPSVSVIIPHFKRINSHWATLRSALEQDYDSFNLIIGCDPSVLDLVIKYINEYRFSGNIVNLYQVQLFDCLEELEETEYQSFLKARVDTAQSVILNAGLKFKDMDTLSASLSNLSVVHNDVQSIVSSHIIPASNLPAYSFLEPLPEDFKKKIEKIRNTMYNHSRIDNILHNLVWFVFFLTLSSFLQSLTNHHLQIFLSLSMLCLYAALILLTARIVARIPVLLYDKLKIWRRKRRAAR